MIQVSMIKMNSQFILTDFFHRIIQVTGHFMRQFQHLSRFVVKTFRDA